MSNWYIDRSKNVIHKGLKEALSVIREAEDAGEQMTTEKLIKKLAEHHAL